MEIQPLWNFRAIFETGSFTRTAQASDVFLAHLHEKA